MGLFAIEDSSPRPVFGRRLAAVSFAAVLVLGGAACGDDDDDASGDDTSADDSGDDAVAGGDGDATLEITETAYEDVSAPAGGSLAVVNSTGAPHTFTADDGDFDSEVPAGESATVDVPAEAGEYTFHCEIHPSMAATLTVE